MHPVLARWPLPFATITLRSYSLCLGLAIGLAWWLCGRAWRRQGLDVGRSAVLLATCTAAGLMGAALVHAVATGLTQLSVSPQPWRGGIAVYGALLGGAWALRRGWHALAQRPQLAGPGRSSMPPLAVVQAEAVVPVLLAQAVGRFGCFLAGCCHGRPTAAPWAVVMPALDAAARHPVALYEATGLLLLAAWVLWQRAWRGLLWTPMTYLAHYAGLRLLVECWRGDAARGLYFGGRLSTGMLLSLVVLGLFAAKRLQQPARPMALSPSNR
ncbi:MAG: prolipoprotein diacylglyceryl transferase [Polyangiales bacterium]